MLAASATAHTVTSSTTIRLNNPPPIRNRKVANFANVKMTVFWDIVPCSLI
jgi:hypothetical protein